MTQPKGFLVCVGGAEDKGNSNIDTETVEHDLNMFEMGVLGRILSLIEQGIEPAIELVTSASKIPAEMAELYVEAFGKLGVKNVGHFEIKTREDADKKANLEKLINCNCVMFTGGDQLRLATVFGGTEFLEILKQRFFNEHFIIAGTSAGAMAMCNTMIYGGVPGRAHLKGEVKMSMGFGLLHNVILDTHFDKRGRFNRLAQAVALQPGIIGIGLGEDTGIIISQGDHITAIGSGSVTIIDGKKIRHNNIADITAGMPISVENIMVHVMANADIYNLTSRHYQGSDVHLKKNVENLN
jgi:cyanophycinase